MTTNPDITELIRTGSNEILEKLLREKPALAHGNTEQGLSLLMYAAYCRNYQAIELIRSYKPGFTLYEAASIGDLWTVRKFIERDTGLLNSFSPDGFTPLGLACFFGHIDIVRYLIEKGADINIASNNQFRVAPIHSACAMSNYELAELLVQKGADVNAQQMSGVTPLHSAAHNGQTRLARLLIENGAQVNARMDGGQTPLFMAEEKSFGETAGLLRSFGGIQAVSDK